MRTNLHYRMPEENVSKLKVQHLLKAADAFLLRNRQYKDFHIDILAINIRQDKKIEILMIEDVYL